MKKWLQLLDELDSGREVVELQWNTKEIWRMKLQQLDEEFPINQELEMKVASCMPPILSGFKDIKAGLHLWGVLVEVGQSTAGRYKEKAAAMHPVYWSAGVLAIHCQLDLNNRSARDDILFGISFGRSVLSLGFSNCTIPTDKADAIDYWKRIVYRVVDQRLAQMSKCEIFDYNLKVAAELPIPASRYSDRGINPDTFFNDNMIEQNMKHDQYENDVVDDVSDSDEDL